MTEEGRKSRLKKEKVRFRNTTSLPNHDYYFNVRLCFLMARIIAVNGPLWVHCPYVVWQFVFCKRLPGNYQFLLWIEEVCSLYKSNLKLIFFSLLIACPFSVPTSTVMQQVQQAVTVSLRQTARHSTFPLSTSLSGLSNHLFNRTSLKTQKSKAGRVWSAFKKRDIIHRQKVLRSSGCSEETLMKSSNNKYKLILSSQPEEICRVGLSVFQWHLWRMKMYFSL